MVKQKTTKRVVAKNGRRRKKRCPFTDSGIKPKEINYKDTETLLKFVTERGKILPRRITGVSAHCQRYVSLAIKRARYMALLPFLARDESGSRR